MLPEHQRRHPGADVSARGRGHILVDVLTFWQRYPATVIWIIMHIKLNAAGIGVLVLHVEYSAISNKTLYWERAWQMCEDVSVFR